MKVFEFLFISSLEWFALIVLTFAMFKFLFRGYWGQIIFTSFMLSLFSYLVFVEWELNLYGPLIQLPVVFLYFWLMYRVHYFYAGLMVVNGYLAYGLLQATLFYSLQIMGVEVEPNTLLSYSVQILTALIAVFIASRITKNNVGFSFVPDTDRIKVSWNRLHVSLLVFSLLGYAGVSCFNLLYFSGHTALLVLALSTFVFGFLQYFVFKKEFVHV